MRDVVEESCCIAISASINGHAKDCRRDDEICLFIFVWSKHELMMIELPNPSYYF